MRDIVYLLTGGIFMSAKKLFTQEEIYILSSNKYVYHVTEQRITYTLEFKQLFLDSLNHGKKPRQIFKDAGISPEILGTIRINDARRRIKEEAASPEGLKPPRGKSASERMEEAAKKDLAEKQTKKAISKLEERVFHLEQIIGFLKKTQLP